MDPYKIIKHPLSTEKSIRGMESNNILIFVVDINADKISVKKAIEEMFKVEVDSVKTHIQQGEKKAYVKFSSKNPAIDVATQLGLM